MNDEHARIPKLTDEDRKILDALIECGFEPDALSLNERQRQRALAIMNLFGLLHDYPVEDSDPVLVDATLARIESEERRRDARLKLESAAAERGSRRGGFRLRVPDFITVAAVFLIGASLLLPIMHRLRQSAIDSGCANNMRVLSYAFDSYAADYGQELPVASAGLQPAWTSGSRNVLNLLPLVAGDYCDQGHLNCPGHSGRPGEGYSYQWQDPEIRPHWKTGRMTLIVGDKNPLIDAARDGGTVSPLSSSPNHGGRGQNVLASDGGTLWLESSVINRGDNIWLPEGVTELRDGVRVQRMGDVFLAN